MKTLRYLLITFAVMMVMSVNAQSLAQEPQIGFQSTSSMVGSGSTLPQAAQYGVYTTYDQGYNAGRANKPGTRRLGEDEGVGGDGEGNDDPDPTNPAEPFPIGDGVWAMMVLACCYAVFAAWRKQRAKRLNC